MVTSAPRMETSFICKRATPWIDCRLRLTGHRLVAIRWSRTTYCYFACPRRRTTIDRLSPNVSSTAFSRPRLIVHVASSLDFDRLHLERACKQYRVETCTFEDQRPCRVGSRKEVNLRSIDDLPFDRLSIVVMSVSVTANLD